MDQILEQHFEWDKMMDERYHCKYCSYNTQLPNKAGNHFVKQHEAELSKAKKSRSKAKSSPAKAKDQDQAESKIEDQGAEK
jgi:hypothetical protein